MESVDMGDTNIAVTKCLIDKIFNTLHEEESSENYLLLYDGYEDKEKIALANLHGKLNNLFDFMNYKSSRSQHFNAEPSRDLLRLIEIINKLKSLYADLGCNFAVHEYYDKLFIYVNTFLAGSGGSHIPHDYQNIDIKENQPVFTLGKYLYPKVNNIDKISKINATGELNKIKARIDSSDYDGAITSCRTLLEGVLKSIYKEKTGKDLKGQFSKMWEKFSDEFNLNIDNERANNKLTGVLDGIEKIITGIAEIRNMLSDSHTVDNRKKPSKHHAILIRNLTLTMVEFLFDTVEYQEKLKAQK